MNLKMYHEKYDVLKNIKRFAMERVIEPQNLCDHGYGVGSLFYLICESSNIEVTAKDLFRVMNHDFAETYTGDINRIVKEFSPSSSVCWYTIEEEVIPSNLKEYTDKGMEDHMSQEKIEIFKLADNLDAFMYCEREYKSGNTHLSFAGHRYRAKIRTQLEEIKSILSTSSIRRIEDILSIF